jgi:uncharacterized protein YndB with AHSA1/START domain
MDIHHAMIVHNRPQRLYAALTRLEDLEVWMGAPTVGRSAVGSEIEFQYGDEDQRTLKMEILRLDAAKLVQWRVVQPVWPGDAHNQVVTWTLSPYENNTLVDFRMDGWPQDDDVYASVSFKWSSFMQCLKIYMGDTRQLATFLHSQVPGE